MRTTTAPEQTILSAAVANHHLKAEIVNDVGVYVDFTTFLGVDWCERATIKQDVNQRVAEATLTLAREANGNSVSPLMNQAIKSGRGIRLYGSRVGYLGAPSYKLLFQGRIDRVGFNEDPMDIVARDFSGELVDRWVEDETEYGTEAGRALESVMQDILNDWAPGWVIYTPVSPSFLVTRYRQQQGSVQSALQALADQVGWFVEYRWDNAAGTIQLQLLQPNRTVTTPDWTFGANDYSAVQQLADDSLNVRNAIRVSFLDATGERLEYEVEDASSIAQYGRQWAEFQEGDESAINSLAKATVLGDAALADLKSPLADLKTETDLFWPIQLGDYLAFSANGVHFGAEQRFAVVALEHVFENGAGFTSITTRGKPVSHREGWLQRERRERPPEDVAAGIGLLDFREVSRTATAVTYAWRLGSDLSDAWIHDYQRAQPYSVDQWPDETRPPDTVVSDREATYTVMSPEPGNIGYLQVEGRKADGSIGDMQRANQYPIEISQSDQIDDGVVISRKLREGARSFSTDIVFSAVDSDTVQWAAGTLLLADGTSYVIAAGNTGNLASDAPRYVYFDKTLSTTVLQVVTAYASAVGEDAILLAVVRRALGGSGSGQEAFYVPAVGVFGLNADVIGPNSITTTKITDSAITTPKLVALAVTAAKIAANTITAAQIAALTITANEIAANTITAAKLNVASLSAISADLGTVTAGSIQTNVLIAAQSFTATNATFSGNVKMQCVQGANIFEFIASGLLGAAKAILKDYTNGNGGYILGTGSTIGLVSDGNGAYLGGGGDKISFYGGGGVALQNVTGSRGGNAALADLLTKLAALNLITDGTT